MITLNKREVHDLLDAINTKVKHLKVVDGPAIKRYETLYIKLWEYNTGQPWAHHLPEDELRGEGR